MDDMVAFISGGGSGIGQAAARLLARRGSRVALAGRTPDQLTEVAEAIGGAGGTAITVICDVSDEDSHASPICQPNGVRFHPTNQGQFDGVHLTVRGQHTAALGR